MRPLAFQLLRELSHERFTSGTQLAGKLGVSRSAVSDALRDAGAAGVDIFSLSRRGYRLAAPLEMLSLPRVVGALGATARRLDLDIVESIDSTNSALIARAAAGAPAGTCLAAELQTAGRGRRGRVWRSAIGGSLAFSLLWRFERGAAQLGGLSLAVGLAVLRALRRLDARALCVQLKWPNDIVVGTRKLGGVLIETQGDMLGPTAAVIGIGLNLCLPVDTAAAIDQPATDLASVLAMPGEPPQTPSRNALLAAILTELVTVLDAFQEGGFGAMKQEWQDCHSLAGEPVSVSSGDAAAWDAVVQGVADDGSLLVAADGRVLPLASGELSIRRGGSGAAR